VPERVVVNRNGSSTVFSGEDNISLRSYFSGKHDVNGSKGHEVTITLSFVNGSYRTKSVIRS
jgi:hypothetical protein